MRDAEYITGDVAKIMEDTINEAVENKTYDNLETRNLIRDKVSKYLYKQTAKRPMIEVMIPQAAIKTGTTIAQVISMLPKPPK